MIVVAQRGSRLLVQTSKDRGRIWNPATNEQSPEELIQSILKFGYWEEPDPKLVKQYANIILKDDKR